MVRTRLGSEPQIDFAELVRMMVDTDHERLADRVPARIAKRS